MSITPGLWEVVKDEVLGFIIPHPSDRTSLVARVTRMEDAHAIAAVPLMVYTMQEYYGFTRGVIKLLECLMPAFDEQEQHSLRKAIAQAIVCRDGVERLLRWIEGDGEYAHSAGVSPQDESNARG